MLDEIKAYQEAVKAVQDATIVYKALGRCYNQASDALSKARHTASIAARAMSQAIHKDIGVDGDRFAGEW